MIQFKHCELCEHPKRSLKSGLTCGLTGKKPDFKVFCPDIKFSHSFTEYLPELISEIEKLKKNKTSVYVKFILFGIIGLIAIFGTYSRLIKIFDMEFGYSSWLRFDGMFLIYLIGIFLISIGIQPLYKKIKSLQKLESDKKEIDIILNKYDIDIETLLNRKKKRHHNTV